LPVEHWARKLEDMPRNMEPIVKNSETHMRKLEVNENRLLRRACREGYSSTAIFEAMKASGMEVTHKQVKELIRLAWESASQNERRYWNPNNNSDR
jgi:hypothetical protein